MARFKDTTRYDSNTSARVRPTQKGIEHNQTKKAIEGVKKLPFHVQRNVIERIRPYPLTPKIGPERKYSTKKDEAVKNVGKLKRAIQRYEDEMTRMSNMPQTLHRQREIERLRKIWKKMKANTFYEAKVALMTPTKVKTEQP
jgi:hypothetical protein